MSSCQDLAACFLKYDYAETKDLAKSFLTLNSATLVFSVAFAEKVVDLKTATATARSLLVIAWSANVAAIVLCGLAICFISLAGGNAVYGGYYFDQAEKSFLLLLMSGCFFVAGLIALVTSAAISLLRQTKAEPPPPADDVPSAKHPKEESVSNGSRDQDATRMQHAP